MKILGVSIKYYILFAITLSSPMWALSLPLSNHETGRLIGACWLSVVFILGFGINEMGDPERNYYAARQKKRLELPSRIFNILGFRKNHKILFYFCTNLIVLSIIFLVYQLYGIYTDLMIYLSVIIIFFVYKLIQTILRENIYIRSID